MDQAVLNEDLHDLTDETDEDDKKRKKIKHRSPMNPMHVFFIHAFVIVLILWLMFGFICGLATAPNNDMSPQIKTSDLLLYYRLDKHPKAQDVVIVYINDTRYVGRIVAAAGDTVEITDEETLVINGNTMNESNIYTPTPNYEGFVEYPVTLSQGEYFVLSDNRNGGEDSRYYGVVKENEILGTVITVVRRNNI